MFKEKKAALERSGVKNVSKRNDTMLRFIRSNKSVIDVTLNQN